MDRVHVPVAARPLVDDQNSWHTPLKLGNWRYSVPYCSRCDRTDISGRWEFCPRCGSGLAASAPPRQTSAGGRQTKDLKGALIDMALDAAQGMLQKKFDEK